MGGGEKIVQIVQNAHNVNQPEGNNDEKEKHDLIAKSYDMLYCTIYILSIYINFPSSGCITHQRCIT